MKLEFDYLYDRPADVPVVIDWWYSIWADRMGGDRQAAVEQLRASLSKTELPLHIIASLDGVPVGSAALKLHEEIHLFPDKKNWLGSVFVAEEFRGEKFASLISLQIVEMARQRNLPHLYLQTVNLQGGLYRKLGWQAVEEFDSKFEKALLMFKTL